MNIKKLLILVVFSLGLSGCAGEGQPMSVPVEALPPPPPEMAMTVGADPDYAVIRVYFATDREQTNAVDPSPKERFGGGRGDMQYGVAKVSIPKDHEVGGLESPSIWRFEFTEDPEKHVVLLSLQTAAMQPFFADLSARVRNSTRKSAFLFVHGYNVTFEDAARRTGQISYDLAFDGAPVFYSWPSQGKEVAYTVDEDNVRWAEANLKKFLADFASKSDAQEIFLIAHSMGNRALLGAYVSLMRENPQLKARFKEIILAAPDVDADVFKRDIAPAMVAAASPITLYASSGDIPLKASKKVHANHRLGDAGSDLVILPGIESIDASNVETSFLGHSYFADEASIISDMLSLFTEGLRADQRDGLTERTTENGKYWEIGDAGR